MRPASVISNHPPPVTASSPIQAALPPLVALLVALLFTSGAARADQGWEGHSLHLMWENDATRGSDRHYTQGGRILYLSADAALPAWLEAASRHLPAIGFEVAGLKYGLEVGQEIYTPEDLDRPEPIRNDRPYAGWLYGSLQLLRRGVGPAKIPTMEQFRIDLGVIGPESLAEDAQKVWHGRDPRGWNHQLGTEPGLALRYERTFLLRARSQSRWIADGLPSLDASVGNIDTHLGLGTAARLGYNIPNRFEVPDKPSRSDWGFYVFGRVGGRYVIRNIFLDGNTWRSSHSVDKYSLVGDASVGVTIVLKRIELTASNNYPTREFVGQLRADSFGSATVSFKF